MYALIALTLLYTTTLSAFILVDAGIQLLGIRKLINKDSETQHENSRNFVLTAVVMILMFFAKLVNTYFNIFSYGYEILAVQVFFNSILILTQVMILYFAWSISSRPLG